MYNIQEKGLSYPHLLSILSIVVCHLCVQSSDSFQFCFLIFISEPLFVSKFFLLSANNHNLL